MLQELLKTLLLVFNNLLINTIHCLIARLLVVNLNKENPELLTYNVSLNSMAKNIRMLYIRYLLTMNLLISMFILNLVLVRMLNIQFIIVLKQIIVSNIMLMEKVKDSQIILWKVLILLRLMEGLKEMLKNL